MTERTGYIEGGNKRSVVNRQLFGEATVDKIHWNLVSRVVAL